MEGAEDTFLCHATSPWLANSWLAVKVLVHAERDRVARISRIDPSPRLGSSDANGNRASKLQHPVQGMNGDVHLGCPTPVRAQAQSVTDDLLEPADGGFDAGSCRVSGRFLPSRSSVFGDKLKMVVALCGSGLGGFARHGRGTWRHDDGRLRMTLGDGGGNALLVVSAVGRE